MRTGDLILLAAILVAMPVLFVLMRRDLKRCDQLRMLHYCQMVQRMRTEERLYAARSDKGAGV